MPGRLPIWASAAEVAREHGVFGTAKILHLEYGQLKRLAESPAAGASPRSLAPYRSAAPRSDESWEQSYEAVQERSYRGEPNL